VADPAKAAIEPLQGPPIVIVVDLEPVALGADEVLPPPLARQAAAEAGGALGGAGLGNDAGGDRLRLVVGEPPHAAVGLHQADREQVRIIRVEHAIGKARLSVVAEGDAGVEKRQHRLIAGGEHDEIDGFGAAVREQHAGAVIAANLRLERQAAMRHQPRNFVAHGRMRLIDGVVGLWHAIARWWALQQPQAGLEQPTFNAPRQRYHLDIGEHVPGREPEHELGHEPVAAPQAQKHLRAPVDGVGDDVGRRVAAANHQHALVTHLQRAFVAPRMQDLAREATGIAGQPRHVVMAAGDDDAAITARLGLAGDADLPVVIGLRFKAAHRLAQFDVGQQPKFAGIVAEIGQHAVVPGIFGVILIEHRQVVEAGRADRGDEMRRLVHDAAGGGDVPQPADVGLAFKAIKGDAAFEKGLGGGKARGAGTDDHILVARSISHRGAEPTGAWNSWGPPARRVLGT